jgi:protein-S-isoprenylcysteine O-methyltransferase Ste14
MFIRALLAFLVLPGIVGFIVPALLVAPAPGQASYSWPGGCLMAVGLVLLLWCVRDFYVRGKGTLAPWDPPRNLVVVGLYR